jgi:protein-tyrosine-phosphatase
MNVLFMCTGNICRSPMAAGLFAAHAVGHALPCTVRSAGLLAEGEPAASGAVEVLAARGVDLTRH